MKAFKNDEKGTHLWRKMNLIINAVIISVLTTFTIAIFKYGGSYVSIAYKDYKEGKEFRVEVLKKIDQHNERDSIEAAHQLTTDNNQTAEISTAITDIKSVKDDVSKLGVQTDNNTQTIAILLMKK